MKLLKIGDQYINLDVVKSIKNAQGWIQVTYTTGQTETFTGTEGADLKRWLDSHADDVTKTPAVKPPRRHLE